MFLYFSILFFLIINVLFETMWRAERAKYQIRLNNTYRGNSLLFYVFLVFFVLLLGFRGLTGTDTITYAGFYSSNSYPTGMELGYKVLSQYLSAQGVSFACFEIIIAFLTIVPLFFVYKKLSESYAVTLLFFYLFTTLFYAMNISRQLVAVSFFVLGVYNLINIKKNKYKLICTVAFWIIAVLFHKITIVAIVGLLGAAIIYYLFYKFDHFHKIFSIFMIVLSFLFYVTSFVYNLLLRYSNIGILSDYSSAVSGTDAMWVLMTKHITTLILVIVEALVLLVPGINKRNFEKSTLFFISIFCINIIMTSTQASWITDRISQFYLPFIAIICSRVWMNRNIKPTYKMFIIGGIFIAGILQFSRVIFNNFGDIYPYISIFSQR